MYSLILLLSIACIARSIPLFPLIKEFTTREYVNGMILFHCDVPDSVDLFKKLSANFTGSLQNFAVDSQHFNRDHSRLMSAGYYRPAILADLDCPGIHDLLDLCSESAYFNASYRWLMFSESRIGSSIDLLKKQDLNIDSRVTLLSGSSDGDESYEIFEVYGTIHKRGGKIRIVKAGFWNSNAVNWSCSTTTYVHRSNLEGITLRSNINKMGIQNNLTLDEYLQSADLPRSFMGTRFGYQIMRLLSQHLNFKVHHIITSGWGFDVIGTNSSKGTIGQLQRHLVDVSTTPLALTTERTGSFDQTIVLATARLVTIFRHPKNDGTRNIFLRPFHNGLWMGVGVVLLVSTSLLVFNFYVKHRRVLTISSRLVLIVVGLFCQQSITSKVTIGSTRIIILSVILFSIVIYQFYSCFIIGYLLVLPPKTIRSLEQLLDSNLKLSIEDLAYNRDFFNRTKSAIALELYERKILPNQFGFVNVSTGIALVKQGGYAFHCETSYGNTWIIETFTGHEMCELQELELYPLRPAHMILPKGSPLKEPFRVTLRLMMDTGVIHYYRRRYFLKRPPCTMENFATVQVVFADIADIFWLLSVGLAISLLLLVVEVVKFRVESYLELRRFSKRYSGWLN